MSVDGGLPIQVAQGTGDYVQESWDGRFVYYSDTDAGNWRVSVEGGEESLIVRVDESAFLSGWDVSETGIYYATSRWPGGPGPPTQGEYSIQFLDFASGRKETLLRKVGPFHHWSLRVSPDEEWILFGEQLVPQSDLMLVENFR